MSVEMLNFIEYKGKDNKWHLVKWYFDKDFAESDMGKSSTSGIEDNSNLAYETEKYAGLSWRNELSFEARDIINPLPNDISDELNKIIEDDYQREMKWRKEIGLAEAPYEKVKHNYNFHALYLGDMQNYYEKKMEEWEKILYQRIAEHNENKIMKRLDEIENLINGNKPAKKKVTDDDSDDEEYYEDTIEYHIKENLYDILYLKTMIDEICATVKNFKNETWTDCDNNIRIIYHMC